jgi:hypothetical protein
MTLKQSRPAGRAGFEERGFGVSVTAADRAKPAKEMLHDLHQLIEALDRRVPRLERVGEAQIARDAANLRERASRLIQQLEAIARPTPSVAD